MSLPSINPPPTNTTSDSSSSKYTEKRTYKRPYRKSVTGCKECKNRKIKCDEARPACGGCIKRFVDPSCCHYAPTTYLKNLKKTTAEDSDTSSGSSSSVGRLITSNPIGTNASTLLELKLMHHYTRSTYGRQPPEHFSSNSPTDAGSMWEVDVPQLAFSNEVVLNAMLGIAAFNLLSLSPNDRELAVASRTYFNRAVVKQRDAVSTVNRENAEPLLVSAVLLAHLNWLYSYSKEAQTRGVDLSTHNMCKGAGLLAERASPWTPQYDFLLNLVLKRKIEEDSSYDAEFMATIHADMEILFQALDDKGIGAGERLIYEEVTADIIRTASLFASELCEPAVLEHHIITILHRVSVEFIGLLENHDPIAMAIMARNISFLGIFKDNSAWWVHGAGENNVANKALESIAAAMPSEYMWTLEFPHKILSKEVKVI